MGGVLVRVDMLFDGRDATPKVGVDDISERERGMCRDEQRHDRERQPVDVQIIQQCSDLIKSFRIGIDDRQL